MGPCTLNFLIIVAHKIAILKLIYSLISTVYDRNKWLGNKVSCDLTNTCRFSNKHLSSVFKLKKPSRFVDTPPQVVSHVYKAVLETDDSHIIR